MNTELHNRIKSLTTLQFLHLLLRIKNHATRIRLFKMRCLTDVELFSRYFFSHYCRLPFNEMHYDAFKHYQQNIPDTSLPSDLSAGSALGGLTKEEDSSKDGPSRPSRPFSVPSSPDPSFSQFSRKGTNVAIAAPRGSAKSTLLSLILPIHSIMYQQEKYITIISSTLKQATQRLRSMKIELTENERLERFFPLETQSSQNNRRRPKTWNVKSINVNGVQVDVFSTGAEIRGITYQQFRPTRIIIDDGENSAHVTNPEQREKLRNVLPRTSERHDSRNQRPLERKM